MRAARLVFAAMVVVAGCGSDRSGGTADAGKPDMTLIFVEEPDLWHPPELNECGDENPTCTSAIIGPPFVLQSDPMPSSDEKDVGVKRDNNGYLGLDQTHAGFDKMWIANTTDGAGTVSKIDAQSIREVARYPTVTCYSLKTGSHDACDGMNGCCTLDDWFRYQARKVKMAEPPHQAVQLTANDPSRTAVDFNGDLFISNRAFSGQSSVTKVAANLGGCIDRNHNGRIDTSSDVNSDGLIATDCNGDGVFDDIPSVQKVPCSNGMKQEYYGVDDECVLWTTNTFEKGAVGRPLALGGVDLNNPYNSTATAWAGSYYLGKFVRIDGNSGRCDADVQLPNECHNSTGPYGAVVDSAGILWATPLGSGKLCYLDTRKIADANTGSVRDPRWGQAVGYGITLDRDQNVWLGSQVARYTPDRTNGFKNLGSGWWAQLGALSGIGIAADSRNAMDYFVWSCNGSTVTQIPASKFPSMKADQQIPNGGWATITMPCYGVGVDAQQNIWGVSHAVTTRALVDKMGSITQPNVNGMPAGNNVCPAGDSCPNAHAYTYSDFTGFGFRNFTAPRGTWSMVVHSSCPEQNVSWGTRWIRVEFEGETPVNTLLTAKARDGKVPVPDMTWSDWTVGQAGSPIDLSTLPGDSHHLEVEFDFQTSDAKSSPKLKSAKVYYECVFEG